LKNPNPGNFAGVTEEMLEILMKSDLTNREFRVVMFLFKEILKKQFKRELIKTEEFIKGTCLPKNHLIPAIRSLIKKGIIKRQATSFRGAYFYEFREEHFGRVIGTKEIYETKRGLKLLQGGKALEVPELGTSRKSEVPNLGTSNRVQVPELGTSPSSKMGTDLKEKIQKSQRQKELDAHEERKRQQIPRGSTSLADLIERCAKGFGT